MPAVMNKTRNIFFAGLILAFFIYAFFAQIGNESEINDAQIAGTNDNQEFQIFGKRNSPEKVENLTPPLLASKSALAYDVRSGVVLYSKDFDLRIPIASLTKLATSLVVIKKN